MFPKKKHIASSSFFPSQICMCQDCMYDLYIIFLYFYSFGEYLISVSQNSSQDVLKIYSIIKYPFFMHALSILSMNFRQQHSDVPQPPFQGFCWSSRVSVHHFSNQRLYKYIKSEQNVLKGSLDAKFTLSSLNINVCWTCVYTSIL